MGLLDRMRRKDETTAPDRPAPGAAPGAPSPTATMRWSGSVVVIDEASHQEAFVSICGPHTPAGHVVRILAQLVPEPSNPQDANAVAVFALGQRVGYLSPDDARALGGTVTKTISKRTVATCHAVIRGGWDRGPNDHGAFAITLFDPSTS